MENTKIDGILIYDEVAVMRHKMNILLQDYNVRIYEAAYDIEVYKVLSDDSINIQLVIMDLGADIGKGYALLAKIREKIPYTPVFIVTANNKRQTFIRCIAEGATDYILKPFEDDFFVEKVLTLLKQQRHTNEPTHFIFDIRSYLFTEMKKAAKGKFNITILMCNLFDINSEFTTLIERKYVQAVDLFYNKVSADLWDTDVFERYGSQTFIGVFPYCGSSDSEKVINKIKAGFEAVSKELNNIPSLHIAAAAITYPADITEPKEILLSLAIKINDKVEEMKKAADELN